MSLKINGSSAAALATTSVAVLTPEKFGAKGDGVTDDSAALNQWAAAGGHLYLPPKTYLHNGATRPRVTVSGTRIWGVPGKSTITSTILNDGTAGTDVDLFVIGQGVAQPELGLDGAETYDVSVEGVTFAFSAANPTRGGGACLRASRVHNLRIENCLTRYGSIGIYLDRAHRFVVANNEVAYSKADGIQAANGSDTLAGMTVQHGRIYGNYVHDTNDDAISVGGKQDGGVYRSQPNDVQIFNNSLGPVLNNGGCIGIYGLDGGIVTNNRMLNPASHFVSVMVDSQYDQYPSKNITVANNTGYSDQTASGSGGVGGPVCMWIGGRNSAFSGNELDVPMVENLRVIDNTFVVSDRSGIWAQPNSAIASSPNKWLKRVIIRGNRFLFTAATSGKVFRGLHLQYVDDLEIAGNRIEGFPNYGALLNQFKSLRFNRNEVVECITDATYSGQDMVLAGNANTATDTITEWSGNTFRKTSGTVNRMVNVKATGSTSYPYASNTIYAVGATVTTAQETTDSKGLASSVALDPTGHISPTLLPVGPRGMSLARRSSAVAEAYSRVGAAITNQTVLTSGQMSFVAMPLTAGQVVTAITFVSGTTALASATNQWFALWSPALALIAATNDDTTAAWNANAEKTLTLSAPYTVPSDGLYYVSVMVAATTVPSLAGVGGTAFVNGMGPLVSGKDTTHSGLTNPASAPTPATVSGVSPYPWCYVR